jgi:hypothetical protein
MWPGSVGCTGRPYEGLPQPRGKEAATLAELWQKQLRKVKNMHHSLGAGGSWGDLMAEGQKQR